MTNPVRQSQTTLMDRYQAYRTRRFLKQERSWSKLLPGWRCRSRRRILVVGLAISFAFMFAVSVLCAFGVQRAPLLWLPACLLFFPLWTPCRSCRGDRAMPHGQPWTNLRSRSATALGPSASRRPKT